MSWETQSWAAKQRPGSASAKLVLLGMASCADANHCAFPSIDWLCEFSDLNRKTVISAVERLVEAKLIEDTGERRGRTRQVKVYRLRTLHVFRASNLSSDPATETVPKPEQSQKRNSSGFSGKESQNRDTEPFREPIPPTETIVSVCPQGQTQTVSSKGKGKGSGASTRLPDDWTPPPIAQLGAHVDKMVSRWPEGALERATETFRQHYRAEAGPRARKSDWTAAFGRWLMGADGQVLRHVKAGGTFGAADRDAAQPLPVANHPRQADEGELGERLRRVLRRRIGAKMFDHYLARLAFIASDRADGFTVIGDSVAAIEMIDIQFGDEINAASAEVLGRGCLPAEFNVERVSNGSAEQGQGNGQGRASGSRAGAREPATAHAG